MAYKVAKRDFCFTYYDGDATRDMAHMDRLERGCYNDIIISIRKFGHLTLAQIKKILNKDFEECWPALELILKVDEDDKYFIFWLENSEEESKTFSEIQKDKIDTRWKKNKKNASKNTQKTIPGYPSGNTEGIPLEDVYEDEDEKVKEFGKSENLLKNEAPVPVMLKIFTEKNKNYSPNVEKDYPALLQIASELNGGPIKDFSATEKLKIRWGEIVDFIVSHGFFKNYSLAQINRHLQAILLEKKNGSNSKNAARVSKTISGKYQSEGTGGY